MALPAWEIIAEAEGVQREYRLREWAWKATWQLQLLRPGATGACDADFDDVAEFPSKQAALDFIETA